MLQALLVLITSIGLDILETTLVALQDTPYNIRENI
ncbi:hypothetical protein GLYMA_13G355250v4 [Glycine max]|nr:hypothetical protein GLYMA_13G355250v4 [Glycine max]KAH1105076.1 hypothetical protein GYH30_038386 [Glycine max]